ncbi:MAG: hypothetical protein AAB553_05440 [Patescibacteria group bacterium]
MLKNKNVQLAIGVGVILAILFGGYFLIAGKSKTPPPVVEESEDVVHELSPKDLGLSFDLSPDGKKVKFIIKNITGIESIEYQLTYEADSTAQEQRDGSEPRVQRGITGEAELDFEDSEYESPWLDLGSCSVNVCRYDKGVESIDLTLKIVKEGKTYHTEDTFEL